MTATTVTINSTFTHLNNDRTLRVKQNSSSIEREAIIDITISNTDTYTTGGYAIDLSTVRGFIQVYAVYILHQSYGLTIQPVIPTNVAASGIKFKFFASTGLELANASAAIQSVTMRCLIRGI